MRRFYGRKPREGTRNRPFLEETLGWRCAWKPKGNHNFGRFPCFWDNPIWVCLFREPPNGFPCGST